jgi:hypothetical protein
MHLWEHLRTAAVCLYYTTRVADCVPFHGLTACSFTNWMADTAHSMDLDIGIKNSFEVVEAYPQMVDKWDFAVNEECFQYGEVGGSSFV